MLCKLTEDLERLLILPWRLALLDLPEKFVKPELEPGGEGIKF